MLFQGTSLGIVAKWLGLHTKCIDPSLLDIEEMCQEDRNQNMEMVEMVIPQHSKTIGKQIIDLALPKDVLIVLITRNEQYIVPSGATTLESQDKVLMLVHKESIAQIHPIFT